jgi:hypothetical protein
MHDLAYKYTSYYLVMYKKNWHDTAGELYAVSLLVGINMVYFGLCIFIGYKVSEFMRMIL